MVNPPDSPWKIPPVPRPQPRPESGSTRVGSDSRGGSGGQPPRPQSPRGGDERGVPPRVSHERPIPMNATPIPRRKLNILRLPEIRNWSRNRFLLGIATCVGVVTLGGLVASSRGDESPKVAPPLGTSQSGIGAKESTPSTLPSASNSGPTDSNWETIIRSVVYIEALGSSCGWSGSGSIVMDGSYVLTNQHVSGDGECDLSVWLTDSTTVAPTRSVSAQIVIADSNRDLAIIRMIDDSGNPFSDSTRKPIALSSALPSLGEKLTILGYPGLGGSTVTLTSGDYSGLDNSEAFQYLKTTANMNPGVSGGAALNSFGELVGIPTAGRGAEISCQQGADCVANGSTIGLLRPVSLARDLINQISR